MAAQTMPAALAVFWSDEQVGTLFPTEPLSFSYSDAWLDKARPTPLHPSLPMTRERLHGDYVHAFFENLLPEGDQRKLIAFRYKVSSVFGMLAAIGGDTASAYVLLPEGQQPTRPIYQRLSWEQVSALLHASAANAKEREEIDRAAAGMPVPRISISGAQNKILLSVDAAGQPWRPMGTSPSTHIAKPDMVRPDINVFASAANEAIVMRAARLCQLPTANVFYEPASKACVVERYDREKQPNGQLRRAWQADFCQIAGKPSAVKYEFDGGPTFKECFDIANQSVQPARDRLDLLRWLFFNLYVGNNDSHAKNLSLLMTDEGLRLAPFYDLMCTRVYSGLGPNFAFAIGGETDPGKMATAHLFALAADLGIKPAVLLRHAADMAKRVSAAIAMAAAEIALNLNHSDKVHATRIVQKIESITKKMAARLAPVPGDGEADIEDPDAVAPDNKGPR
jgi:serine/threonine-protein kinase HipA